MRISSALAGLCFLVWLGYRTECLVHQRRTVSCWTHVPSVAHIKDLSAVGNQRRVGQVPCYPDKIHRIYLHHDRLTNKLQTPDPNLFKSVQNTADQLKSLEPACCHWALRNVKIMTLHFKSIFPSFSLVLQSLFLCFIILFTFSGEKYDLSFGNCMTEVWHLKVIW